MWWTDGIIQALSPSPRPTVAALASRPLPQTGRIEVCRPPHSLRSPILTEPGFSVRETAPQPIPTKPPYTAHLGNLSYDVTDDAVNDFFQGCEVSSVRLIEDRETQRPKGFGYVEFADVEGLKKALALDGETFQSRPVRIKVADPRKLSLRPCCSKFVLTLFSPRW